MPRLGERRRRREEETGEKISWPTDVPPPPCMSYAKVPNQYGPYAYCSLDKAVDAQVQKEKIAR